MKSNLAHEPPHPQGEVVQFPKQERQVMPNKDVSYTKTPNYLVDEDYVARMTGNALKCYTIINRFTEGFSRGNWAIDSSFLLKKAGIKKPHTAYDAVKQLEEFGLLSVHREDGRTNKFTITHPCQKTAVVPNLGSAEKGNKGDAEKRHNPTAEKRHTKKENIKENIKEIHTIKNPPKNSVDEVLSLWIPDLHSLNSWLQRSGEKTMTQDEVNLLLPEVNAHYEGRIKSGVATNTKMYANFVKWVKSDYNKYKKQNNDSGVKQGAQAKPNQQREQAWADYYAKRNQQQPNNIIDVIEVQHD